MEPEFILYFNRIVNVVELSILSRASLHPIMCAIHNVFILNNLMNSTVERNRDIVFILEEVGIQSWTSKGESDHANNSGRI